MRGPSWLVRSEMLNTALIGWFDRVGGRLTALLICLDVFVLTSFHWLWRHFLWHAMTYNIESGAGLWWHLARMALQVGGWGYAARAWVWSEDQEAPSSASHYSDFLPSFFQFMMNALSGPE